MFHTLLKLLINQVLPHHCLLCNKISPLDKDICQPCWLTLPWLLSSCHQCGRSLDIEHISPLFCGECLKHPPHYDTTIAPLRYQDEVIPLITKLKFYQKLPVARLLGELITERIIAKIPIDERPTLLIPVPLHPKRLRRRGYNQAILLANHISKLTHIPVNQTLCQRVRHTPPQSKTKAHGRQANITGAFRVNATCHDTHIALIDDVMTTGATVDGLSQLLKQHGVARVSIWCAARV